MNLEELRAQAEAEEVETTEAEESEAEVEDSSDTVDTDEEAAATERETFEEGEETEEVEASDDFELELDGEPETGQQKPSPEDALFHRLTAKHHKYKKARDERDVLAERVKELESQLSDSGTPQTQSRPQQPVQQYPPVPVLYEDGIDTKEQYTQAYQKWMADCKAVDQSATQADQQKTEYKRRMEEMTHNLAKRVGKFAVDNKIKDERVIGAIEKATSEIDGATKIEGSLAYLLDAVGDGGERAAYYIGTNETALAKIKGLLEQDNSGLKAISEMTRMAERLKPKHSSRTSKAPSPDRSIKGDGASASNTAKSLQDKWEKATDPNEMLRLRAKARELGVKLT